MARMPLRMSSCVNPCAASSTQPAHCLVNQRDSRSDDDEQEYHLIGIALDRSRESRCEQDQDERVANDLTGFHLEQPDRRRNFPAR